MELIKKTCKCDPNFTVNGKCPHCGYNYTEAEITVKKPKKELEDMVSDLFMDFLFYDRKDCEMVNVRQMRELMDNGTFSKELMIEVFTNQIENEFKESSDEE